MQAHRFYCEDLSGSAAELAGSEAHHLTDVLRLGIGDEVELFDGAGGLATARVKSVSRHRVTLVVERLQRAEPRRTGRIIIAASIAKGERFDWVIGKCTELGVYRICPVVFERTVKQPKNPKTLERWTNIARAAAKQCGRLFLPRIDAPMSLAQAIEVIRADYPDVKLLVGNFNPDAKSILAQSSGETDVAAFIGPEGGFTEDELNLLKKAGAKSVCLTDTTLRVETAAMAFAAILAAKRTAAEQPI